MLPGPTVDAIIFEAKKEDIEKAVGSKREEGREMRTQLNTMKCLGFNRSCLSDKTSMS